MKKNILISLFIVLALVLSSCAPKATEQPAAPEEEQITLVFWSMWNEPEPQAKVIAAWIQAFEAQHPNINIEVVWNGRENQTKVRTALAAGTKIDLVDQDADQIAGGLMSEGMGYPLDEFLTQKALDEDVSISEVFTPGVLDTFLFQGKHYLWPYINNPVMWWYNKDIFDEVGVQPPKTWDELLEISQKIKDAGYTAIVVEGDVFDYNMFIYGYYLQRLKGNGYLLSVIEDKTGEKWKEQPIIDAMRAMRELWDKGYIPAESAGQVWPAGQTTLATGESAMELCGGWLPTELRDTAGPDFRWGGFPFPEIEGGVGKITELHSWLLAFMILKDTEHPQEAFEFLKFIMTKENQTKMAQEALVGVTRVGVAWAEAIKDGEIAAANATGAVMYVDGAYAYHAEYVTNVLTPVFMEAFYGKITPEEFAEKMAEKSKEYWASK